MHLRYPRIVIALFFALAIGGGFAAFYRLHFSFNFEDFFPKGDPDMQFYNEFKTRFEPDDNFMLIAIHRKDGIFDQGFLKKVKDFSVKVKELEFSVKDTTGTRWAWGESIFKEGAGRYRAKPILAAQSLLQVEFPIKTPFAFTTIPAIHIDEPERYASDKKRILADERLVNSFISQDANTTVVILKTVDNIQQEPAEKLILELRKLLDGYQFEEYHLLGRANFQTELVKMQIFEFALSAIVSALLVWLIMWLIFRRFWGVVISLLSIAMGLLIFIGVIGVWGRPLDSMALLYPIIMIIVGTSDVIHVMSKYVDELQKGHDKKEAIRITFKEIGLAVFLTSFTTAIGFFSLISSKLEPIQNFGINASLGVMIAYCTVLIFTTSFLTLFDKDQIIKLSPGKEQDAHWHRAFHWVYTFTSKKPWAVWLVVGLVVGIGSIGMSRITTNTKIEKILPIGASVTEDFHFFEKHFSGFRPFEIAVMAKDGYSIDSFEVVQEMAKLEAYLKKYDAIRSISSITWLYKSFNQAFHGDKIAYFKMPESKEDFEKYQKMAAQAGGDKMMNVLLSKDHKYARISARILDVGGDNIKAMSLDIQKFIANNTDSSKVSFRQTGTGVIVDKNSEYIRNSLMQGLGFAVLLICLFMALVYRNLKMLLVAMLPNLVPLVVAAAILGFGGIPLEGGAAIVFSIIFGIAVDDTIHILGRFKLLKGQGLNTEEALRVTLHETGKAVTLTTVILFFGFVILLFSSNPPAVTIGLLISSTLVSALLCDVFIIPVMLRALFGKE